MMNRSMSRVHQRESGTALVVALVLIAISTLLGIYAMESSSIETRLASNEGYRETTFRAAEHESDQALEGLDVAAMLDAAGTESTLEKEYNDEIDVVVKSRMDGFAPLTNSSLNQFRTVKVSVSATASIDSVNTSRTVSQGAAQRVPNQPIQ